MTWTDRDEAEFREWLAAAAMPVPPAEIMAEPCGIQVVYPSGRVIIPEHMYVAALEANRRLAAENAELRFKLRRANRTAREWFRVAVCCWLGAAALIAAALVGRV